MVQFTPEAKNHAVAQFSFLAAFLHRSRMPVPGAGEDRLSERAFSQIGDVSDLFPDWRNVGLISIDTIRADSDDNILFIHFSESLSYIPIRHPLLVELEEALSGRLGYSFRNYRLRLYSRGRELHEYVPNYFRTPDFEIDSGRIFSRPDNRRLVRVEGRSDYPGGLSGSHIALWPSHGYYYSAQRDRWEWQRARLYGTIEDLFAFSYIQPWLLTMLENAGAYELMHPGQMRSCTLYPIYPKTGNMQCTYVSWVDIHENISGVRYRVNHSGGSRDFLVDQTMGAGTWIYLG